MSKANDFGRDSIPLLVLKISIPFMIAQFVNVFYSIVDRIANVNHFFTLLGKMFFTPYGKEFFSYSGKQIFTS